MRTTAIVAIPVGGPKRAYLARRAGWSRTGLLGTPYQVAPNGPTSKRSFGGISRVVVPGFPIWLNTL